MKLDVRGSALWVAASVVLLFAVVSSEAHAQWQRNIFRVVARGCGTTRAEREEAFVQTGVLVDHARRDGRGRVRGILTTLHGVASCDDIVATPEEGTGALRDLKVMSQHIAADLALLAYESTFPERGFSSVAAPTLATSNARPREMLDAFGYSWGRSVAHVHTVMVNAGGERTFGQLLAGTSLEDRWTRRRSPAMTTAVTSIDGALVPGLSGAPLMRGFDSSSPQIVALGQGGLVDGGSDDTFAIPVSVIREFLDQLPPRRTDLAKLRPKKDSGHFAMATDEMRENLDRHAQVLIELGALGVFERQLDGATSTRLGATVGVSWDLDPTSPISTLTRLQAAYSYGWTWAHYVAPDGSRGQRLRAMAHDLWFEWALGVHLWRNDAWSLSIDGGLRLGFAITETPDFYYGAPLTARLRNDWCVIQLSVVGALRPTYDTHYTGFLDAVVDDTILVTSVAVEGSFAFLIR